MYYIICKFIGCFNILKELKNLKTIYLIIKLSQFTPSQQPWLGIPTYCKTRTATPEDNSAKRSNGRTNSK
jgi:hypothetical protein